MNFRRWTVLALFADALSAFENPFELKYGLAGRHDVLR